jgi:hypothetical protein
MVHSKEAMKKSKKSTVCGTISGVPFSWRNNITTSKIEKVIPNIIRLG